MNNLTAFGELLNSRMQRVRRAGESINLELGTVGGGLELAVDSLKDSIPKGEYLVSLHLTGLTKDKLVTQTEALHAHVLPEPLRGISPGDRVLVAWAGGQPVIVDIVAGSKELTLDGR